MQSLIPISGCGAKGPACFLVETASVRILLDLGYGPQPGLWPDVSAVGPVDALLLSHSHRDHAGALRLLPQVGNPPVYATDIVRRLLPDGTPSRSLPLRGSVAVCGVRVTTGRNGHAPGGVWLHLEVGGGLLYMGDYSVESTLYAHDAPPAADTVILDASYGVYDTPLAACAAALDRALDEGPALMPVPAAGRGADIALRVMRSGRGLPHIDDALRSAFVMLAGEALECVTPDAREDLRTLAQDAPPIEGAVGVMLATVADATSGEASRLVKQWESESAPALLFTGYLPPGTPAERLTQSGRARYVRWNVHPRLSDNAALARASLARTVLPAFGEARHLGAWETAFAPARVALQGPVRL